MYIETTLMPEELSVSDDLKILSMRRVCPTNLSFRTQDYNPVMNMPVHCIGSVCHAKYTTIYQMCVSKTLVVLLRYVDTH